jgi:hypothetical protein
VQKWQYSPPIVRCASCGISGVILNKTDKTWQKVGGAYFCEKDVCRQSAVMSQFGVPPAMRRVYEEPPRVPRQEKREPIPGLLDSPLETDRSIRHPPIRRIARIQREMEKAMQKQPATWLEELQHEIWDRKEMSAAYGQSQSVRFETTRKLHPEEWEQAKAFIEEHGYPCELINTRFGFGLGMAVFEMPPTPGAPAELLLLISDEHLSFDGEEPKERWEHAWTTFSAITHSDQNRSRCEFAKITEPKPKDYYTY